MSDIRNHIKWGEVDHTALPGHIAVILDGNGRWALSRGLSRSQGHAAGAETLDRMFGSILELGIKAVSLYAFSTENWKRPDREVAAIWTLLNDFFQKRIEYCKKNDIKIQISGDIARLPAISRGVLKRAIKETASGSRLIANFCINYGGQAEIVMAANHILKGRIRSFWKGSLRKALRPIQQSELEQSLYTAGLPPVDLLIRPGGEHRISNFLIWQIAYAEILVVDTLWPDFDDEHLLDAILWYQKRDRRFGGLQGEMKV